MRDGALEPEDVEAPESDEHPLPTQRELYRAVAPFAPLPDHEVLPAPSADEWKAWAASRRTSDWTNYRIAHKFDDGWYLGTFRGV